MLRRKKMRRKAAATYTLPFDSTIDGVVECHFKSSKGGGGPPDTLYCAFHKIIVMDSHHHDPKKKKCRLYTISTSRMKIHQTELMVCKEEEIGYVTGQQLINALISLISVYPPKRILTNNFFTSDVLQHLIQTRITNKLWSESGKVVLWTLVDVKFSQLEKLVRSQDYRLPKEFCQVHRKHVRIPDTRSKKVIVSPVIHITWTNDGNFGENLTQMFAHEINKII